MKRFIKIVIGLGFVLIALVVAGVAVLSSMDFNEYKSLIAEKAKEATGRDLVIAGNLDLNISLNPSISVNGVTFSNASWGSRPEMLSLDSFAAEVALIPLLSETLEIKQIVLEGVDLLLETDGGGHGNWAFQPGSESGSEDASDDSGGNVPVVHSVLIRDVNVQYLDGVTGLSQNLNIAKLELSADGANDPMSLLLEAVYNNENINVAGTLGSISALSGNDMFPVKLDVSALGARIGLDGTVKEPQSGTGLNMGFSVNGDDVAAIAMRGMALAGVEGDAPLPARSLSVSGALRDVDGGYAIDGLNLKIGGSDLSGNLSVNLAGARPGLNADVSSNHFDLADVQAEGGDSAASDTVDASGPDDGRVFPNDPLPLDGLKSADANISFNGKEVKTSGITLGNVLATIDLNNGRLNVSSFGFDFGGGRIEGDVGLDGSSSIAKLALNVDGKKIDYGKILKEMAGEESVTGMVDISLSSKGAGDSVRSLMAGLNGKLRIVSEEGHIESGALSFLTGPLAGLMGDGDTNDLRCAVIDFDIVDGIATSEATVFETGGLSVIGAGGIDLREEKLDLYFDPRAKSASVASAAEVGIVVGGTLKEPSVGPDVGDVAMGAATLATGIATGGVSLLLGAVVDSVASGLDNTDYCALALAGKPLKPDEQAQSGDDASSDAPASSEQPPAQDENPVEGVLDSLFGN